MAFHHNSQSIVIAGVILSAILFASQAVDAVDTTPQGFTSIHETCREIERNAHVVRGCAIKASDGSWSVVDDAGPQCAASATFVDSAYTASNFGKLRIVTGGDYSDADQVYAAGFIEGYLTAARIYDHHFNLRSYFDTMLNESAALELALDWLEEQEQWAAARVASAPPSDPYWRLLGWLQQQFNGLVAGYQAAARREQGQGGQTGRKMGAGGSGSGGGDVAVGWLERRDLMFLNGNGDVYDIIDAMEAGYGNTTDTAAPSSSSSSSASSKRRLQRRSVPRGAAVDPDPLRMSLKLGLQGKCSALLKVTGDLGDLLLGHSTHDSFTAMTRIYKHVSWQGLAEGSLAARSVSFSSYPGELFSDDDFYLLSSGLAVLETTNHIYVGSAFAPLTPACVLSWQRLRLANWLAGSGEQWVELFSRHNSGTYNNQYMIVDTKRFLRHKEMRPGLLWVVEQLPGMIKSADMTGELSRGYWPSYNVAFFPEVYQAAGYPDMISRLAAQGAHKYSFPIRLLRYQVAPRAAIFRRDQGGVTELEGLKRIMRYNDWQHDPYAEGNPVGAVCPRGDLLEGPQAIAKGCYDSKVTSASMIARMESEVVGGPTAQGQPPFSWSDPRWTSLPHRGMPNTFNFTFERMSPRDLPTRGECRQAEQQQQQAVVAAGGVAGRFVVRSVD